MLWGGGDFVYYSGLLGTSMRSILLCKVVYVDCCLVASVSISGPLILILGFYSCLFHVVTVSIISI